MEVEKIDKFDGEYAFLSNFYPAPVKFDGMEYPDNESAFQAQKCPARRAEFLNITPKQAKHLGRKVELRSDWDDVKDDIMHAICICKFAQNPELAEKLIATGNAELIEGNYWHDHYWGVCNGTGKNKLGKILMDIRAELIAGTLHDAHPTHDGVFWYAQQMSYEL